MTAATHPLFGRVLSARGFKRFDGVLFLVVGLPDGSPGTVRVDATDVLGEVADVGGGVVLDVDGVAALRRLVLRLQRPGGFDIKTAAMGGGGNA